MIRQVNGKYWNGNAEITESEYIALMEEIKAKAKWVDDISTGKASIEDCPVEWQEEIAERVEQRIHEHDEDEDIPVDEALDILLGGAI